MFTFTNNFIIRRDYTLTHTPCACVRRKTNQIMNKQNLQISNIDIGDNQCWFVSFFVCTLKFSCWQLILPQLITKYYYLLLFFLNPSGVVGILPTENRLPVTMGDFINLSLMSHSWKTTSFISPNHDNEYLLFLQISKNLQDEGVFIIIMNQWENCWFQNNNHNNEIENWFTKKMGIISFRKHTHSLISKIETTQCRQCHT